MQLIIQREDGSRAEAVALAVESDRMRIVLRGGMDTVELTKWNGCWQDEHGAVIEIEGVFAPAVEERPRAMSANGALA